MEQIERRIFEIIARMEQHEMQEENQPALAIGDTVIIKIEEENRNLLKLEVAIKLFNYSKGSNRACC